MEIKETHIPDLVVIQPQVFGDERGFFMESWNREVFESKGLNIRFDQDNMSLSQENVLRGLHMQLGDQAQGKLVRTIKGSILDVAVDLRPNSKTFGAHFAIELSEENKSMLWVPKGFAHGFLTQKADTIVAYKCEGLYNAKAEISLLWNDPELGIAWGTENPLLSAKDQAGISLKKYTELLHETLS